MGIDFIAKAKDAYQKKWARGCEELKVSNLFTLKPEEIRTILVRPETSKGFCASDTYTLHVEGDEIRVYSRDRLLVGVSANAPQSILNHIRELGGETIGLLRHTHEHSGLVDLYVHWGIGGSSQGTVL